MSSDSQPPQPLHSLSWFRRFVRIWGFALFVLLLLIAFRAVILPFLLGVLVAYLMAPVVQLLSSVQVGTRHIPRWLSVVFVFLMIATALGVFFTAFLPHLSGDVARLLREAPAFFKKVKREYVPRADAWMEQAFPSDLIHDPEPRPERKLTVVERRPGAYDISLEGLQLELEPTGKGRYIVGPRSDAETRSRLTDFLGKVAGAAETEFSGLLGVGQRLLRGVIKGIAWFVLTFMVAAYLLVDLDRVMAFLRSLVPDRYRENFDELVVLIDRGMAGVIRGQLMICVVNGILTYIGLLLFDVKYSFLLAIIAGAMSFIPVFGSILSSVPIVLVALVSGPGGMSLSTSFGVLAWIVGIHFVEANLLNPKIIGTAAKIHPVLVIFALMVGESTSGLVGALLAVPIASMIQVLFVYLHHRRLVDG